MIRIKLTRDTVSPDLRKLIRQIDGSRKAAMLKAISDVLAESCAKRAFDSAPARPAPWVPKKDGSPATLRRDNLLSRSPRTVSATPKKAILGSDRKYAATHQFGSTKKGIPARPYMPFLNKKPTPLAVKRGSEAVRVFMRRK